MDKVKQVRVGASLGSMASLIDATMDDESLTEDDIRGLVEAAVLEGQFILEVLNPGSQGGPNPSLVAIPAELKSDE